VRRFLGYERVLVVTAVEAERAAVLAGLRIDDARDDDLELGRPLVVTASGVGIAAAAATTAQFVTVATYREQYFDVVLSAGVGGGFPDRVAVGGLVLASESVAADLGAESPDGFVSLDELGFGTARQPADPTLLRQLRAALPEAVAGPVLTVSTVTGTAEGVAALRKRYPDAAAEAMEGFGVATGAKAMPGIAFGEVRTISNTVGPRDRVAWRLQEALDDLRKAFAALARHQLS
jgi:futalosine hydrolase